MKFPYIALAVSSLALVACEDVSPKKMENAVKQDAVKPSEVVASKTDVTENQNEENASEKEPSREEEVSIVRAKVTKVVGEGEITRGDEYDWRRIRQGQKVIENDHIRTSVESEVNVTAFDGTVLSIFENTSVVITAELLGTSQKVYRISIDKGNILFDVQKQKKDQFIFKTGTATASIRGTAGFIGNVNGQMVASLKEGEVEVTSADGKSVSVFENQTVLMDEKGESKKLELSSSGTKALTAMLSSVAAKPQAVVDLEKTLKKFDDDYATRKKTFVSNLKFKADGLEQTIYEPKVTLKAQVTPGIRVSVLGETDSIGANGVYERTFTWDEKAQGTKRFLASCGDGVVEVPCFTWTTKYMDSTSVAEAKTIDLSVKIDGASNESVQLQPPTLNYFGNFKFRLKGIESENLDLIQSIVIYRGKSVFETLTADSLKSDLSYERQIQLERNSVSDFSVAVKLINGKTFWAKKTYEVVDLVEKPSDVAATDSSKTVAK